MPSPPQPSIRPRIILHGGAGSIHRSTLPPSSYSAYRHSLLTILSSATTLLMQPQALALDIATHAVSLLENDPLFNAGKGAVFTIAGTNELEASVMVSSAGSRKRGVGVMLLRHVKNPILLAKEMLLRGEADDGGGAAGHVQLAGEQAERLGKEWGLEMVETGYFWTKRRWEEHERGMGSGKPEPPVVVAGEGQVEGYFKGGYMADASWDGREYLPQGTVGCVVLDRHGTICVATSTGGLTNKLPGRIGDTPTIGAGFFAEEWDVQLQGAPRDTKKSMDYTPQLRSPLDQLSRGDIGGLLSDCLPFPQSASTRPSVSQDHDIKRSSVRHVAGISGTGNGDSFLKLSAVRTAIAASRFGGKSLQEAVTQVAGPGGALQQSADEHWKKTFEGEGGMIGIELVGDKSRIVDDFNCGGMFRAWVDEEGEMRMLVFRGEYEDEDEA